MGQLLSEPITSKDSSTGSNSRLIYAASGMQGWRITMEDSHTAILDCEGAENTSFFGVYDGHGGSKIAKYAGVHAHKRVISDPAFGTGNYVQALENGFLGVDIDLQKDPEYSSENSGCTAVVTLLTSDNRIICANAGDSRCVLSAGGRAQPLSFDHKPTLESETARIQKAGGYVQFGRVNGNLALSRAMGDFEFKQNKSLPAQEQVVTVFPDVMERKMTADDEFFILACDGIWDCLSNQEVVDFIRERIAGGKEFVEICEELMDRCVAKEALSAGVGCDNMTVVIVGLLNDASLEDLRVKCRRPRKDASAPMIVDSSEDAHSPAQPASEQWKDNAEE